MQVKNAYSIDTTKLHIELLTYISPLYWTRENVINASPTFFLAPLKKICISSNHLLQNFPTYTRVKYIYIVNDPILNLKNIIEETFCISKRSLCNTQESEEKN